MSEGRSALLKWLNDFFGIGYTKVEQCASGAIHCQIMDACFPGKVPLHKVNFEAKLEHEFVQNFKVLQSVFTAESISKYVDVPKLVKAKYQDNLEFLQWMREFFLKHYGASDYDGRARREEAMKMYKKAHKFAGANAGAAPAPSAPAKAAAPAPAARAAPKPAATKPAAKGHSDDDEVSKLRLTIEGLEKERNFYFGKLREIEILCQTDEHIEGATKKSVLDVLYKTDGDEEFQTPNA